MTELRRLSEGPLSVFDRAALRSAAGDRPSNAAKAAAQAALGIGVVSAGTAIATTAAGTAGSAAKKIATGIAFAKMAAMTIVAGIATAGVSLAVFPAVRDARVATPNIATTATPAKPIAPSTSTPAPSAPPPEPAVVRVDELPTVPSPALSTARVSPARSTTVPASRLGEETAVLAAVRSKLAAGDTAGAHAALDTYVRDFESGVLAPEASALRVDAFVAAGDRSTAAAAARRYLTAYPSGAAAARMRRLIDSVE